MKSNLVLAIVFFICLSSSAQTLIATSNYSMATAYSQQRKIVRDYNDNVYVVFTDVEQDVKIIKGVYYNAESEEWSDAEEIVEGQSPTLAIDFNDRIYMVYESNDYPDHKIMYMHTSDFESWTSPVEISNTLFNSHYPIADIDSIGVLNVFWIEEDNDYNNDILIYCNVLNDSISETIEVVTKDDIYEISIANHLQYFQNDLFFAISFFEDSIQFFRSTDYLTTIDTIYESTGLGPCISFNSYIEYSSEERAVRFLYADYNLWEAEAGFPDYSYINVEQLPYGPVSFVSIDDIAPPIGYSFLFIQNEELIHGFSYGSFWNWSTIMSSYQSNNNIYYPSIAYKHFNPLYVDFIWMENMGNNYNIYYKREEKHQYMPGIEDKEDGKGFLITGNPNPFQDRITINVVVEEEVHKPIIEIYSVSSQFVKELSFIEKNERNFTFIWDGKHTNGNYAKEGIYLVLCSVGDKRTARKIIYSP